MLLEKRQIGMLLEILDSLQQSRTSYMLQQYWNSLISLSHKKIYKISTLLLISPSTVCHMNQHGTLKNIIHQVDISDKGTSPRTSIY